MLDLLSEGGEGFLDGLWGEIAEGFDVSLSACEVEGFCGIVFGVGARETRDDDSWLGFSVRVFGVDVWEGEAFGLLGGGVDCFGVDVRERLSPSVEEFAEWVADVSVIERGLCLSFADDGRSGNFLLGLDEEAEEALLVEVEIGIEAGSDAVTEGHFTEAGGNAAMV